MAFTTATTAFTTMFSAALKARPDAGIVNLLNRPNLARATAGQQAVTARITTAVTMSTPTDGTLATNGAARTNVALTKFIGQHPLSLDATELGQWDADADAAEVRAFVDAAILAAETEILADLVAATAGTEKTLSVGQRNFGTDATDGEIRDNLDTLYDALVGVLANVQGKPDAIVGWTHPTAYKNLMLLADSTAGGPNIRLSERDRTLFIKGYPVYMTSATDNGFGAAADLDTFYWVHQDAEALTWSGAGIFMDMQPVGDGFYKKIWQSYGYAGLIQASHFATVKNGSA